METERCHSVAGDEDLLRALHDEHGEALFAHALRLTGGDRQRAEDLVQETLVRAWQHPEALNPERGSVRAWLFTTARNLAIDAWRRRSSRVGEVITDAPPETPVVMDETERAVETWKRGVAVARVRNFSDPDDRLLHLDLVNHLLARELIDVDLEALVEEARAAYVRTPTLELAAARLAFATGRPRDALEPLEWLVGLDDDEIVATGASYDERVFGEWSWGLIGLCRFALGDDEAAADAFRRAERYAPGDASYVVRRRLAEARAGSSA